MAQLRDGHCRSAGDSEHRRRHPSRLSSALSAAAVVLSLWLSPGTLRAEQAPARDLSLVKAGYVLKIPLFIDWPSSQWLKKEDPLVIGVLGDSRMLKYLLEVEKNSARSASDRPVQIKEYSPETYTADAAPDVLFITGALCEASGALLRINAKKSVMSVGDCGNFIRLGGMFRLLRKGANIALEANRTAIERAGLTMSFRLATVAKIVSPETSAP